MTSDVKEVVLKQLVLSVIFSLFSTLQFRLCVILYIGMSFFNFSVILYIVF